MTKNDIATDSDIKLLVDKFYDKVVLDSTIGFIFNEVMKINWETHLPNIYAFWITILLGKPGYFGNTFDKHLNVATKVKLTKEHFDKWMELWQLTVNENFEGPIATNAITRAQNIAMVMQMKIGQMNEGS